MAALPSICCYAAGAGVASHLGYFIHGEHHTESAVIFGLFTLFNIIVFSVQVRFLEQGIALSIFRTSAITTSYVTAIWTSITVYRLFFHRLRSFPGPLPAKVSKLWHSYQAIPKLDSFRWLAKLHQEYGDVVRTGPNELSFFDPAAVSVILGPKCSKGPFYDITLPLVSMQTTRDKQLHAERRRIWDKGINVKALRMYEERVLQVSQTLMKQVAARNGQVIEARDWFLWFSFDCMGTIAFGKSFGTVDRGESHFALEILKGGTDIFGIFSYIPWAFPLLTSLPGNPFNKFVDWCAEQVEERKKIHKEEEVMDVMSHLIQAYYDSPDKVSEVQWLNGDARLIVLAGTETTGNTLTHLFYHLAASPSRQSKLRAELTPLIPKNLPFKSSSVHEAPYLNAFINETMRLAAVGLSGMSRVTPPEGIMIGKTFVPGNVTVVSPHYVSFRHPNAYENPDEFIPERWNEESELIKDKSGFAPWSLGPTACVGKQIALMEMRMIISLLVTRFSVSFAPGDDGSSVIDGVTDHFASTPGPLKLVFTALE